MHPKIIQHPLGYWEISEKPTLHELQEYYANKYYQEPRGSYELEYSPEELLFFRAKLEQRWAVIQRYCSKKTGQLLDVGCGEGYTLAFFRELGWSVTGLDFSAAGIRTKNPGCLDALVTGDIYQLLASESLSGKTYDLIWLQNVLEHVIDPLGLLTSIRSLVSADGIAVVTVPNDCSITQRAALELHHIEKAFWVAPPDHLNYFEPKSLQNAARATHWQCLDILGDFPIDWFLFHPGSNYVHDQSLGKAAHRARVQLENLIQQQPINDVINFWSALAKLGFGRVITAFLRPTETV